MRERLELFSRELPEIDQVTPQVIESHPGARLSLGGRNLGGMTGVEVGGREAEVLLRMSTALVITLPPGLSAGAQVVQVFRDVSIGNPPVSHRLFAPDPASFVLRPRLVSEPEISGDRELTVAVEPPVAEGQRVALLLNEIDPPAGRPPASHDLPGVAPGTGANLRCDVTAVQAGRYLVRVQVDGVSSALAVDNDPDSPTFEHYVAPAVAVPSKLPPSSAA